MPRSDYQSLLQRSPLAGQLMILLCLWFLVTQHLGLQAATCLALLALRSRYAEPQKKLADPMKYYDPSYYNAAMRPR